MILLSYTEYTLLKHLGKGSKIKLIIFAEFSANGGGDTPHPWKWFNFFKCSENVQNALKHKKKLKT